MTNQMASDEDSKAQIDQLRAENEAGRASGADWDRTQTLRQIVIRQHPCFFRRRGAHATVNTARG